MSQRRFRHFNAAQVSVASDATNFTELAGDSTSDHQGMYIPPSVRDNTVDTSPFDPNAMSHGMPLTWGDYENFKRQEAIENTHMPIDVLAATAQFNRNQVDAWSLPKYYKDKVSGPRGQVADPWAVPQTFGDGVTSDVVGLAQGAKKDDGKFLRVESQKFLPQYVEPGNDFIGAMYGKSMPNF